MDNTSDKDKPVSTEQQTALDKKVNFADISRSTAVNIAGKKVLDAMEKNALVEGTLAHDISQIYSNIQSINKIYVDKEISWAAAFEEIARKHNAKYAIGILSYYTPTHVLLTPPPGSGFSHVALLVSGHQKWRFVIDADIINSKL